MRSAQEIEAAMLAIVRTDYLNVPTEWEIVDYSGTAIVVTFREAVAAGLAAADAVAATDDDARVDRTARAIFETANPGNPTIWDRCGFTDDWKIPYLAQAKAALSVAAPAVGVTVAWVNKQIADIDELVRRSGGDEVLTGKWIAYRAVRALLTTAQPADDAGEE